MGTNGFVRCGGDGNRIQQVDFTEAESETTAYTNDNTTLSSVLVASNGITNTTNLTGLDLTSHDNGNEVRTFLTDGLGSNRVEMVGSSIRAVTTYEPFGKVLAYSGESGTVYGYTGEQFDVTTGLVYLRARYYNPTLKLFMSRDPFPGWSGLPASQHGYSYAHNNPVNLVDPTGRNSWAVQLARTCKGNPVACAIAAALGYAYYQYVFLPDFVEDAEEVWDTTAEGVEELARDCVDWLTAERLLRQASDPEPDHEEDPDPTRPPVCPDCDLDDDGRKAAIIGAGPPVGLPLEQVKNIAHAYKNNLIVNEPTIDWNLRKDRLDLEGLVGVRYHHGDAQKLGLLDNTDIFAVAPNYGYFEPGILMELVEIANSILGFNSELYLAMDAGQANQYAEYVAADMMAAGYRGDLIMSWSQGTHSPPISINGHSVNFISDFFDSNTGANEQNRLIKIWR